MKRPAAVALACLLIAVAGASAAPPREPAGLLKAALAGSSLAFQGVQRTQVWTDTGDLKMDVRVRGNGKGGLRSEYSSGTVILRLDGRSWNRSSAGAWTALPSRSSASSAGLLLANYRVSVGAPGTLCGRKALPLVITATRSFNPSRKMWVDADTGLILRDDLFAPDGKQRSSTRFTSVAYIPQAASLFQTPAGVTPPAGVGMGSLRPVSSSAEMRKLTGHPTPAPSYIPAGYRVVSYGVVRSRRNTWMPSVRYEDGLGAFTVFERNQGGPGGGNRPGQPGRGGGPGGGRGRGGPRGGGGPGYGPQTDSTQTDRQETVISIQRPGGSYLLVGDIAATELKKVAQSL